MAQKWFVVKWIADEHPQVVSPTYDTLAAAETTKDDLEEKKPESTFQVCTSVEEE